MKTNNLTKDEVFEIVTNYAFEYDYDYFNIINDDFLSFLDVDDDRTLYKVKHFNLDTRDISDLLYKVFEELEKKLKRDYGINVNINLYVDPLVVFYVIYGIIFGPGDEKNPYNYNKRIDYGFIITDSFAYGRLSSIIGSVIEETVKRYTELNIYLSDISKYMSDVIFLFLNKFMIKHTGFFNYINNIFKNNKNMYLLFTDYSIGYRHKKFDIRLLSNKDIDSILKLPKDYLINITTIDVLVISSI